MFLCCLSLGKGKGTRYLLYEREGDQNPHPIAYFDDLESAGLVMRYLKGSTMPTKDQEAAIRAMKAFDSRPKNKTDKGKQPGKD